MTDTEAKVDRDSVQVNLKDLNRELAASQVYIGRIRFPGWYNPDALDAVNLTPGFAESLLDPSTTLRIALEQAHHQDATHLSIDELSSVLKQRLDLIMNSSSKGGNSDHVKADTARSIKIIVDKINRKSPSKIDTSTWNFGETRHR